MDRLEWIALAWHAQLGPAAFHKLIARFGGAREVMEASSDELLACKARLTRKHITAIREVAGHVTEIAGLIEELEDDDVRVLCPPDEAYPPPLRELTTAPPVLSMAGEWLPEDTPGVAIVGTRSPSVEGAKLAEALGAAFAAEGLTVVSGLARGIDTAGHHGALVGDGRTIAVLGSGIRQIHPRENQSMARAISQQGAVMSELTPDARPNVRTLMARNRLQSALSNAVVVVESKSRGGSMQTAADALRQDRLLFAVDWSEERPTNTGTRRLLREGAVPLRSAEDAADAARLIREHVPESPEPAEPEESEDPEAAQLSLF